MVRIVDYRTYHNEDGEDFFALVVQGGITAVKSKASGRTYLTNQQAKVSCTFDEETCKTLIGSEIAGKIVKVEVEPFEYTVPDTGEIITLTHRNEFITEEEAILNDNLQKEESVI